MRNVTQIAPFKEPDMKNIYRRLDVLMPDDKMGELIVTASSGYTHTFRINGEPAAIVGANILWPGVAQVWAVSSDLIRGFGLWYTKMVDQLLTEGAEVNHIRRYHCVVDGNSNENVRWLYTLKFEYEFCMHKAAPDGTDVFGYVRWEV